MVDVNFSMLIDYLSKGDNEQKVEGLDNNKNK
jgi:hypothetical protein